MLVTSSNAKVDDVMLRRIRVMSWVFIAGIHCTEVFFLINMGCFLCNDSVSLGSLYYRKDKVYVRYLYLHSFASRLFKFGQ